MVQLFYLLGILKIRVQTSDCVAKKIILILIKKLIKQNIFERIKMKELSG